MTAIFDVLAAIGDAIVGVIEFVISLFMDLVYIIQLIGSILIQIPSFFTWLPPELSTLIIITLTVAAIYKIAGRD